MTKNKRTLLANREYRAFMARKAAEGLSKAVREANKAEQDYMDYLEYLRKKQEEQNKNSNRITIIP